MARDIVKPHRTNHVRRARKIVTRSAAARAEGTGGNLPDAPHSEPDNMSTDSEGGVLLETATHSQALSDSKRGPRVVESSSDDMSKNEDLGNTRTIEGQRDYADKCSRWMGDQRRSENAAEAAQPAVPVDLEDERRTRYLDMIEASWGASWSGKFCKAQFLPQFENDAETSRHHLVRDMSLTLVKHFAVVSAWATLNETARLLKDRVVRRRRDQVARASGQPPHITPADIKGVLLEEVKLPEDGMTWDRLARDGLVERPSSGEDCWKYQRTSDQSEQHSRDRRRSLALSGSMARRVGSFSL